MCGIIGYIGKENPKNILIEGLKNLEYRGYDSAGIALKNENDIQIIKSVGKISNLEEKISSEKIIEANIGIAHTRWATHGEANEINAHPHQVGRVTLVHNGIIENADDLRKKLVKEGTTFKSQTDTEVACALINHYYKDDITTAITQALTEIKGSYAFGIVVENNPNLYAVRKDSQLIIGINDKELFIASDISAIINYTNKYILLEENEIATLTKEKYIITKDGKEIKKEIEETKMNAEAKDKCGYEHYMLKEIMEEPRVLEETLKPYLNNSELLPDLSTYEEIHIVACGSAMYAGMIGKTLLEEKANLKCYIECASEYRYKKIIYDRKTLVILISQSGETADTIAAMKKAKENNIDTLAIVNVKTSTIAREADKQLFIEAGPEIAVATTKAYILQVAVLALLSYKAAFSKKLIQEFDIEKELKALPKQLNSILEQQETYKALAKKIYNENNIFFIGRKIDYSICLEGSLKLKEVSYIHSEAYQAGELKHGTISLINDMTPVIAVVTDEEVKEKTISNIEEVKSRGAFMIVISTEEYKNCHENIVVPKINDFFQPILVVPVLQLLAYEVAKLRDCDIDKPKNLAKSVTVE
ncbi:MAG: glutamine--fructose-6-phosphate transaminase (isomerizing) [Bacilli bacterium]|nr:glutamine--fructose-6-phosphate transaminase (isomerizing) [Bacilli bacterium]